MKIERTNKYYVYILECNDGTYYTGYTNNLEKRIESHNKGRGAKYVRGRGPVKLVYCKEYKSRKYAMKAEINIKKRTKKEKEEIIKAHKNIDYKNDIS